MGEALHYKDDYNVPYVNKNITNIGTVTSGSRGTINFLYPKRLIFSFFIASLAIHLKINCNRVMAKTCRKNYTFDFKGQHFQAPP